VDGATGAGTTDVVLPAEAPDGSAKKIRTLIDKAMST
jgi:hypothetical protein